jgi:MFS family permease
MSVKAPSALLLAEQFNVPKSTATYVGSAPTILNAFTSFFWIPLSHRIGRRPVLLIGNLIALVSVIGVAYSQTFAQALGCRMVATLGGSVGLSIGPAAISDMFFLHEKGKRMGINSILLVIGPYVGKFIFILDCVWPTKHIDLLQGALLVVLSLEAAWVGVGACT